MPAHQSSAHTALQTLASLLGGPAEHQQQQNLQEQGPGSALHPLPLLLLLDSWLAAAAGQAPQRQAPQEQLAQQQPAQQHEAAQQPQQPQEAQPSREQRWRPHVPLPGPSDRAARRQQAGLPLRTPPGGLSQPSGECWLAAGLLPTSLGMLCGQPPSRHVSPAYSPPPAAVRIVQQRGQEACQQWTAWQS